MTTSGSDNYSLNARQLCEAALRKTGRFGIGSAVQNEDLDTAMQALNVMIKAWQTYGLWLNQEVILFLSEDTKRYALGTDRAVSSKLVTETDVTTAAVALDINIEVTSTSGMTAADKIGVVLDDNTIHWDVIAVVTDATHVQLTTGVSGAAADGNAVYSYTSVITRPLEVSEARLRDENNRDVPLTPISRNEYMSLAQKDSTGTTSQFYFDPQLSAADFFIWPTASDERKRVVMTVKRKVQDLDSIYNDLDFPQEWARALIWNVADEIKVEFGTDNATSAEIERKAARFLAEALETDRDNSPVWFEFHG